MMEVLLFILISYLLGSIPFGLIIASVNKIDIRSHGSGNIGATNVYRVIGKFWGLLTFFLDAMKGFLPAYYFLNFYGNYQHLGVCCGLAAILGHTFPIYIKFRGGKGVATSAGMLFGIAPIPVFIGLLVWIIIMFLFRFVSLASITASVVISVIICFSDAYSIFTKYLITIISILIIWLHRDNISRLIKGTENRFGKKGLK